MPRFDFDPSITPIEHFASCSPFERKILIRDLENFDIYVPGAGSPLNATERATMKTTLENEQINIAAIPAFLEGLERSFFCSCRDYGPS